MTLARWSRSAVRTGSPIARLSIPPSEKDLNREAQASRPWQTPGRTPPAPGPIKSGTGSSPNPLPSISTFDTWAKYSVYYRQKTQTTWELPPGRKIIGAMKEERRYPDDETEPRSKKPVSPFPLPRRNRPPALSGQGSGAVYPSSLACSQFSETAALQRRAGG